MISADLWVTFGLGAAVLGFLGLMHVVDEARWRRERERETLRLRGAPTHPAE